MADRTSVIRELAGVLSKNHHASVFAVGWLMQDATSESLEELLEAVREYAREWTKPSPAQLLEERFTRRT